MVAATRSASNSPVKKFACATSSTSTKHDEGQSRRHFILPKEISDDARFLLLRHPQNSSLARFLFCPAKGLFLFNKVNASSTDPRSLVLCNPSSEKEGEDSKMNTGHVSKSAEFYVATPFDLAFILIPLVIPAKPTGRTLFQPFDDLLEPHTREDASLRYLLDQQKSEIERALAAFCDTIEAGDEQMYRPNEGKTLRMLMEKAENAISRGLPASLEERFVSRALETPILSVKRSDTSVPIRSESTTDEECNSQAESFDSQLSAASTAPSAVFSESSSTSSISTAAADTTATPLAQLQRQHIVLDFILSSYVADSIADRLRARLETKDSPIDFGSLREHLKSLATLRAEANASRSIGDFSRKRGLEEDEAAELRAEKKLKQEEDERKKKLGESRGVRDLKKVNVSGMKKMSDFFSKKPVTKVG